ncbi:unnamed protein product [Mortierella alpina]
MTTTGPAAVAATTRIGVPDEDQDMAVIWKRTLVELHRLDEIQASSDKTIAELDKLSEGQSIRAPLCQEAADKARDEREIIQRALEGISLLLALRDGDSVNGDNSPEGKRKKRKIEAEGLLSNSKKFADTRLRTRMGSSRWDTRSQLELQKTRTKYVVEDDEADDYGKKMTYTLHARSVIMIVDDQESVPEFPAGHTVLALYPSTTCFYKAMVVQPPSKNKDYATPLYRIKFDDDEGNERTAPPRMVLDMPKLK